MKNPFIPFCLLMAFFLSACSDGDGGSGDGGPQAIAYTGNQAPADIDSQNASVLANEVLGSESAGTFAQPFTAEGTVTGDTPAVQYWSGLVGNVVARAGAGDKRSINSADERRQVAVTVNNETESCSGGGSLTLNGTLSDVDSTGTLTVTFDDCVEAGLTVDGETTFDFDVVTDDMADITVSFTTLNLSGADIDLTQSGTVRIQLFFADNNDVITLDVIAEDGVSGETLMLDEFVIRNQYDDIRFPNNVMQSWDGRLFHSIHGYVDVETIDPFCYTNTITEVPDCGGQILLTGEGNASLRIMAVSGEQVLLELDEDGDGTVDISRTMTWEELAEEIDIAG